MANQIILPHQRINFEELYNQFPKNPTPPRRKLFFQCELRSLENGDATFGLICYPAWRTGLGVPWTIGTLVRSTDDTSKPPLIYPIIPLVAFGNNEIILAPRGPQPSKQQGKGYDEIDQTSFKQNPKFTELLLRIEKEVNAEFLKKSALLFEPTLSENTHVEYKVTLDYGGLSTTEDANPRPPYPPGE